MAGSEKTEHTYSDASSDTVSNDGVPYTTYVHVLLLSSDKCRVLMEYEDDQWDLPCFIYENPNSIGLGTRIARFCRDLRHYFGVSSTQVQFNATVELMGRNFYFGTKTNTDDDVTGMHFLIVAECQPDGYPEKLPLPNKGRSDWKEVEFLSFWVDQNQAREDINLDVVLQYLRAGSDLHISISDPRLQMGWFKRASHFLVDTAREDGADVKGHVIQEYHSFVSTLMRVNSLQRWYYAKSPAQGSNEVSVTTEIAKLFPESSPKILATSTELNCFVSRGFNEITPDIDDLGKLIRTLGEMQLKSLSYLEELSKAGCPVRDLDMIMEKIQSWQRSCPITESGYWDKNEFLELLSIFMDACRRLQDYNIPCTLVHGDFAQGNATFSGEDRGDIWLFDWQLACISHPFSDFYRLVVYEDIPEELLNEVVDEYLGMWEQFENIERAREVYQLAWKLGFFLKLWELDKARLSCDYQVHSRWVAVLENNITEIYETLVGKGSPSAEGCE